MTSSNSVQQSPSVTFDLSVSLPSLMNHRRGNVCPPLRPLDLLGLKQYRLVSTAGIYSSAECHGTRSGTSGQRANSYGRYHKVSLQGTITPSVLPFQAVQYQHVPWIERLPASHDFLLSGSQPDVAPNGQKRIPSVFTTP